MTVPIVKPPSVFKIVESGNRPATMTILDLKNFIESCERNGFENNHPVEVVTITNETFQSGDGHRLRVTKTIDLEDQK